MNKLAVGKGNFVDVPEKGFYNLLSVLVRSYSDLGKQYYSNHIVGLADFNGDYYSDQVSLMMRQFSTIDAMVEDEALLDELHSLRKYLQELEINDQKIVSEYASYYNLISNDGEISRKKLKKKIHADRVQGNRIPENVLTIAKQSEIIYFKIMDLGRMIEERIIS